MSKSFDKFYYYEYLLMGGAVIDNQFLNALSAIENDISLFSHHRNIYDMHNVYMYIIYIHL